MSRRRWRGPVSSAVRLAPSLAHGLRRLALVFVASGVITAATILIAGAPVAPKPGDRQPEPPYGPSSSEGVIQVLESVAILVGGVFVARRWLKVRL